MGQDMLFKWWNLGLSLNYYILYLVYSLFSIKFLSCIGIIFKGGFIFDVNNYSVDLTFKIPIQYFIVMVQLFDFMGLLSLIK